MLRREPRLHEAGGPAQPHTSPAALRGQVREARARGGEGRAHGPSPDPKHPVTQAGGAPSPRRRPRGKQAARGSVPGPRRGVDSECLGPTHLGGGSASVPGTDPLRGRTRTPRLIHGPRARPSSPTRGCPQPRRPGLRTLAPGRKGLGSHTGFLSQGRSGRARPPPPGSAHRAPRRPGPRPRPPLFPHRRGRAASPPTRASTEPHRPAAALPRTPAP